MTKKEVDFLIGRGSSHNAHIPGLPTGVTKFQVFLSLKPLLEKKLYWQSLRKAYDMSDNLFNYRDDVRLSFLSNEPQREYLMFKAERESLKRLPEQFTIYRGMTEAEYKNKNFGISWTLKKEVAEYFAYTYPRNYGTRAAKKVVHELFVDKNDVTAYFDQRKEFEVIYLPASTDVKDAIMKVK